MEILRSPCFWCGIVARQRDRGRRECARSERRDGLDAVSENIESSLRSKPACHAANGKQRRIGSYEKPKRRGEKRATKPLPFRNRHEDAGTFGREQPYPPWCLNLTPSHFAVEAAILFDFSPRTSLRCYEIGPHFPALQTILLMQHAFILIPSFGDLLGRIRERQYERGDRPDGHPSGIDG